MRAVGRGYPVAVHCVEAEAVRAAADVLGRIRPPEGSAAPHRIEHASELPPEALEAVRSSGVMVVTNPGFIHFNGERYLRTVPAEEQPWLYRIGALHRAGVPLAFGSDAPVEMPEPLAELAAAVTRSSSEGGLLGSASEAVAAHEACPHRHPRRRPRGRSRRMAGRPPARHGRRPRPPGRRPLPPRAPRSGPASASWPPSWAGEVAWEA